MTNQKDGGPYMPVPLCHFCFEPMTDVAMVAGKGIGHCDRHADAARRKIKQEVADAMLSARGSHE